MGTSGPSALGVAVRSAALPLVLGARWIGLRDRPNGIPRVSASLPLAAKVVADELFLATEVISAALISGLDRRRVGLELASAVSLYESSGWFDEPARYHETPSPIESCEIARVRQFGLEYQHLQFESEWEPHPYEPGRDRWLGYQANRTAHARLMVHPGRNRPWVICTPGFRMGHLPVDLFGFRVRWLHEELGLNVAIPVLPFHGSRTVGSRGGDGFLTGDLMDLVHAQAQAVWDIRRLIGWLRNEGAPAVGIYGVSLGGYTVGLLTALEAELDCVIAGIPASDWVGLLSAHAPTTVLRLTERLGFPWENVKKILRVVSPLAMPPKVSKDRCFVFAGTSDRLAPPEQARDLWQHWGEPRMCWYDGSHVSYLFEPSVKEFVLEALRETGMLGRG